ncbi:hypothetical protein MALU111345_13190 [Marinicrinis lubricantis]
MFGWNCWEEHGGKEFETPKNINQVLDFLHACLKHARS